MIPCWPPQKWASETDWHVSCDVSIMRRWPHELLHGEAGGDGVRFRASVVRPRTTRAIFSVKGEWRPEPESNRRARICSPLRNHSAIGPRGPAFPEARPRGQALGLALRQQSRVIRSMAVGAERRGRYDRVEN